MQSNSKPAVTVLMSVYNGEKYLSEAIDSILTQTFTDFEFIIIDDASTDTTNTILQEYAKKDARIRLLRNEENIKLAASLNRGLLEARAPLVARMDADDISFPFRLERQYAYMKEHPEIIVSGSYVELLPDETCWEVPLQHDDIQVQILFDSPFMHPTVIMRKDFILQKTQGYDPSVSFAQDYDLWVRLSLQTDALFSNIPEVYLRYRIDPNKPRDGYRNRQNQGSRNGRMLLLEKLGMPNDDQSEIFHCRICNNDVFNAKELLLCSQWLQEMYASNDKTKIYNPISLRKCLNYVWYTLCRKSCSIDRKSGLIYLQFNVPFLFSRAERIRLLLQKFFKRICLRSTRKKNESFNTVWSK